MPAPFKVLPCSYSRRTDGPIPCTHNLAADGHARTQLLCPAKTDVLCYMHLPCTNKVEEKQELQGLQTTEKRIHKSQSQLLSTLTDLCTARE